MEALDIALVETKPALIKKGKFTLQENSVSAIPIELNLADKWQWRNQLTFENTLQLVSQLLPEIEQLANAAFRDKDKKSWDEIQKILYSWNILELFRINIVDHRFVLHTILRNKIIEIEQVNKPHHLLECKSNFTPKRAIEELYDKAKSHRINCHPFLETLNNDGLSVNAISTFLQNYYVNNRAFHLFVATQSLFTPIEMRTEVYKNLYEELGAGDNTLAHPNLFLKNFDTIGKPDKVEPLPEALYLFNSKFHATFLSGHYHFGMGGLGFIEITMPEQMMKILSGLKKSRIPEQDLEFWKIHIIVDLEHGKAWFEEMEKLIRTSEQAEQCLQGGLQLIEARATMYDGIWNSINR